MKKNGKLLKKKQKIERKEKKRRNPDYYHIMPWNPSP
jgi:hypothetical protein